MNHYYFDDDLNNESFVKVRLLPIASLHYLRVTLYKLLIEVVKKIEKKLAY